jgi:hypothetical protein
MQSGVPRAGGENKAGHDGIDLMSKVAQTNQAIAFEPSEATGQLGLGLELKEAPASHLQESDELRLAPTPEPLRNVRRHADGRPSHLRYQAELFLCRKLGRRYLGLFGQVHRLLPSYQIPVGADRFLG